MAIRSKQNRVQSAIFLLVLALPLFLFQSISHAESESIWRTYKGAADRTGLTKNQGPEVSLPFEVLWKYAPAGKSNGFVDWGPVFHGDTLYTPDGLNNLIALNTATGEVLWQKQVLSNIFSVSLSEDANVLFVTTAITTKPTATLYALNPQTGDELWTNMSHGQPAVGGMEGAPAIHDGVIYAPYLQYEGKSGIVAYNVSDGKLLWHWNVPKISPYSPVTYADGRIYVGYENKAVVCINALNGQAMWAQSDLTDLPFAAPVVSNRTVYIAAGSTVYAFDAATGNNKWKKSIEGQVGHSSPVVYKKQLLFGTREGIVYALNSLDGQVEWTLPVQGAIESSFALDEGREIAYLATQENLLFAIDLKNKSIKGQIRLSEDPRGVWKSSPVLYQGKIYVGSLDRNLYALK